jgi:transcriptional regulator with XRE-family HTH domain
MTGVIEKDLARKFQVVLGDELRQARERRGWSRRQLIHQLSFDVSLSTIVAWEVGMRSCSAVRVWQLCLALDEPVDRVYARVVQRLAKPQRGAEQHHLPTTGMKIDLRPAAALTSTQLGPLQKWAALQLDTFLEAARTTVVFTPSTVDRLAQLCGLETPTFLELVHQAGLVLDDY